MIDLNFRQWLEANSGYATKLRGQQGTKPKAISQYQVRDLRTAPYGPFTGFRDTPGLVPRIGSDILHGMQNFYSNVRDDSTAQPVRPTYDITRDFKIDSSAKLAIVKFPWSKKIFYKTDKDGNYLNDEGDVVNSVEYAVFDEMKNVEKRATEIMKKYIARHPEIIKELLAKDADIDSLTYVDADELDDKDDDGNEMVMLKFATRIWNPEEKTKTKYGVANPQHKYNVVVKANQNTKVVP